MSHNVTYLIEARICLIVTNADQLEGDVDASFEVSFARLIRNYHESADPQSSNLEAPQHFLNFLPLPQGQGSFRLTF